MVFFSLVVCFELHQFVVVLGIGVLVLVLVYVLVLNALNDASDDRAVRLGDAFTRVAHLHLYFQVKLLDFGRVRVDKQRALPTHFFHEFHLLFLIF